MRAIIALAGLASGVAFCLQPPSVALARRYIAPPSAAGVRQLRSERRRSERPAVHMDASLPGPAAGRRRLVADALGIFVLGGAAAPTAAKEVINDCEKWAPGRRWLTGKSCQDKGSGKLEGTKKDPKYLRALQDCKAQGQAPGGKEESNNDINKMCRDQVCTTYEQCTYQIGPKEDYGGFFF